MYNEELQDAIGAEAGEEGISMWKLHEVAAVFMTAV